MMEAFIWKIRYAWHMYRKIGNTAWLFCWKCAGEHLIGFEDAIDEHPVDCADEEMSYWSE